MPISFVSPVTMGCTALERVTTACCLAARAAVDRPGPGRVYPPLSPTGTEEGQGRGGGERDEVHGQVPDDSFSPAGALQPVRTRVRREAASLGHLVFGILDGLILLHLPSVLRILHIGPFPLVSWSSRLPVLVLCIVLLGVLTLVLVVSLMLSCSFFMSFGLVRGCWRKLIHPRCHRPRRPISVSAVPFGPGTDIWRSCRFIGAMMRSLCLLPPGLLAGTLPLRYCTARFASRTATWRLPVSGHVARMVAAGSRVCSGGCA